MEGALLGALLGATLATSSIRTRIQSNDFNVQKELLLNITLVQNTLARILPINVEERHQLPIYHISKTVKAQQLP